ncbi:LytR/AlgR family response regulator transcription factor [Spongiimicrobium sp. 3-5]|uniref:LytR/AlgR family response regulator transcription factor n=1 Tax=Spongiimicrobium sp. 3-5 TaxID=3332596 RepID=UPI00397EF2D4
MKIANPVKFFLDFLSKPSRIGYIASNRIEIYPLLYAVCFFLIFFLKPFGLDSFWTKQVLIMTAIYSTIPPLLYFIFANLYLKLIQKWLPPNKLTFFLEALYYEGILLSATLLVYWDTLFISYAFMPAPLVLPADFVLRCFFASHAIGVVIFMILKLMDVITHYSIVVDNGTSPKAENFKEEKIVINGEYKNNIVLSCYAMDILYFEADSNNVIVSYVDEDEKINQVSIRRTLKDMEKEFSLEAYNYFRCHRSFIINLKRLKEIRGNTRSSLAIIDQNIVIPVSRSKLTRLKKIFLSA